ncbi:P-loop containing nucleoside triphosphate hydrolases superfamily protein isoform 2 [Hibiscus syriacus]|uniref:Kinesin-like protein n=1 Tax=Hibiscus syriacus TaxID=106335 RepID=A0A6A2ZNV4_HIBSY|nr:P-loop containing nucleoside triphosphate hydrolases superfamily protein isoform 2 [Hibiscus syriacus]
MESTQLQRRGGGGGLVSLSPSQTPRSNDKSVRDLRSADSNSSSKHDKDKGVNVQVILRCRPLGEDEARINTPVVISCNESRREVCAVQSIANKQIDRTFLFDKVFGPSSQQKELFDLAVSPIVNEVLEGYNCTIFAYGQTGTGKTYTMEGGARKKNGEFPSDAGVIPRAVKQIFYILEAQNAEYSMKVTFLELYNEEITDLLAPEETTKFIDDKSKKPIALMEDGKGGVFVRGLEEEIVTTANEIYKILEKGSAKRRTAETLLNKQSSRSHSIFSITIHIKECTPEGEEMIKCGKLNLVDLAGSENISRSGAREGRAREAGEINKSLLTLGRVINGLVEHSGHVPYRDSKLTRLLRDSLGGKTKTCIIATISPSIHCLEETLSTLDYAHRAKNIKNKPEINQKMMKSALIKDLYSEIDRLKQEVYSAREKNGIYIPRDRFLQDEAEKKAMAEKIERMELESESKEKQITELQELYNSQQLLTADLKKTLVDCAFELRAELENAASDVSDLFAKIERKDKIEDGNKALIQKFQSQLTNQLDILHKTLAASVTQQEQQLKHMEEDMHSFVSTKSEATEKLRGRLGKLKSTYGLGVKALDIIASKLDENFMSTLGELNSEVSKHSHDLEDLFKGITYEAEALLNDLQSSLYKQEEKLTVFARQQHEAHSRAVDNARLISKITANFFETLDMHASKLTKIVEEAQIMNDNKLSEFEKKFEECAADEEKQLLQKVAELLAGSSARKKKLVQMAVHDLRDNAFNKTTPNPTILKILLLSKEERNMQEVLQNCMKKAKTSSKQWRNAQESLLGLEKSNVDSVDSIVRGRSQSDSPRSISGAVSTALEDVDTANNSCLTSIDRSMWEHELHDLALLCGIEGTEGWSLPQDCRITENAGKCLEEEYMVDKPSCSTPRKRAFNLPSMTSIEELKTPPFEELLKVFWEGKSGKLGNGDIKHALGEYEAASTAPQLKDSRLPLTAIN